MTVIAPQVPENPQSDSALPNDDLLPSTLRRSRYKVALVEKAAMPAGGEGSDWHRYVLASGNARITGLHRGTLEEVTEYAAGCAEEFNLRTATGKSTRMLTYKKKK
jgi:hypothetical protein